MVEKISPRLLCDYFMGEKKVNVILSYNSLNFYRRKINVEIIEKFPFVSAVALSLSSKNLLNVSALSEVNYIASVQEAKTQMNISKKVLEVERLTTKRFYGENQTIAVIDTGLYPHMDMLMPTNRVVHFQDLINGKTALYDDNGHGTMVAGVSMGNGLRSCNKYSGIATKAKIVAVKSMDNEGSGSSMDILRGMQWVYDNRRKYNIGVVCMSLGAKSMGVNDPLAKGAEVLSNSGVVVVAASGNTGGKETVKSPGICPNVITVGSYDDKRTIEKDDDEIAKFSSCGPTDFGTKPDLLLPGVKICSACRSEDGEGYAVSSGTSVSAGIMAGVSAVILEKYGKISGKKVLENINSNLVKKIFDKNMEGEGFLYF